MLAMRYCDKLQRHCDERGWEQADLWRAINKCVSRSTVSNWFNDESRPNMAVGLRIARALALSLDYMADDTQDEPSPALNAAEEEILSISRTMGLGLAKERLLLIPRGAAGFKLGNEPERPSR
jgi:transcriptional regulator with XRE-family HTH domain